ncbi:MAG: prolipoprotein diacylglyceryl transferase [archaeon]
MFINNINPDIATIGPFSIRFYGIVYAAGFLLINYLLVKLAENKKIKNLTKDRAENITMLAIVFGIIGARLFHVITDFQLYRYDLIGIFEVWKGGLGYHGGILFGGAAIYFYCKKYKINILEILDNISIPLALITTFGRLANYVNSEMYGAPTNLPWCVIYQRIDDICRHPTQIYQAISMLILFLLLVFISRQKYSKKNGVLFWSFITLYGSLRFITDFFRFDYHIFFLGLSLSHLLNLLMVIIGIYCLSKLKVRK